jgi:hypothetical protein
MCKKCGKNSRYWIHIADEWTEEEKTEMLIYLKEVLGITVTVHFH